MATSKKNGEHPRLDTATLQGDVRDAILAWLRMAPDPWERMTADQQRETIDRGETLAEYLVVECVRLVSAKGFPTIAGKLVKCQIKDAMQLQVDASRHDVQRLQVIDNVGRPVVLVIAAPELFAGEKGPPTTSLEKRLGL